jgi:hypothetical protein
VLKSLGIFSLPLAKFVAVFRLVAEGFTNSQSSLYQYHQGSTNLSTQEVMLIQFGTLTTSSVPIMETTTPGDMLEQKVQFCLQGLTTTLFGLQGL